MGTWPIYKKHFLQLILTKINFHLIKYLLATFIFFLSFQSVLVSYLDYTWNSKLHYDVMKWKHYPRYCPFVWAIHRSPVDSLYKGTVTLFENVVCKIGVTFYHQLRPFARDLQHFNIAMRTDGPLNSVYHFMETTFPWFFL